MSPRGIPLLGLATLLLVLVGSTAGSALALYVTLGVVAALVAFALALTARHRRDGDRHRET